MAEYVKPVILVEECSEGIYLASGDNAAEGSGYACESQYIQGNWQPVSSHQWGDGKQMIERGCEGCSAYNQTKCNRNEEWFQLYGDQRLMPTWEAKGKLPTDPWDSLWQ